MNTFFQIKRVLFGAAALLALSACVKVNKEIPPSATLTSLQNLSFNFDLVVVGTSKTTHVSILNDGTEAAVNITFTSPDAPFVLVSNTCGSLIPANASCELEVSFTPTASGEFETTVDVSYNNGLKEVNASVTITGRAVAPASLAFTQSPALGTVVIGTVKKTILTLTNSGGASATGIALNAPGAPFLVTGGDCGTTLAAGASCSAEITFVPSASGTTSGTMSADYQNGFAAAQAAFDVIGSGATPASVVVTGGYRYGSVTIGQTLNKTYTFENQGEWPAGDIEIEELPSPFSLVSTTCTGDLDAGETCEAILAFTPSVTGPHDGLVELAYQDGLDLNWATQDFQALSLSPASISVTPSASLNFPRLAVGLTSDVSADLKNDGESEATGLNFQNISAPFSIVSNTCPSTLAPLQTCSVTVRFEPTDEGLFSSGMDAAYESGTGAMAYGFALSGEAFKRLVFVSSAKYDGNLGGTTGADEKCQIHADSRGLTGVWMAVLSSFETDAFDRLSLPGTLFNLGGQVVAGSTSDLTTGNLTSSVRYDETGTDNGADHVWTGTRGNGESSWKNCVDWNSSALLLPGKVGSSHQLDRDWLAKSDDTCLASRRLYCVNSDANFSRLKSFTASTGDSNGEVKLKLEFPAALDNYDVVRVFRSVGSEPPGCLGLLSTEVATMRGNTDREWVDDTAEPGKKFGYRACVFDASGTALTSTSTIGIAKAPHYVFVTSKRWQGDLGGTAGADLKCTQAAGAAGLPGPSWKAILSTADVDARDAITITGRIYTLNGTRVANSTSDLWDASINKPVRFDEYAKNVGSDDVWTGTNANGTRNADTCVSWTNSLADGTRGRIGDTTETDADWLSDNKNKCNVLNRLYCISQ